MRKGFVSPVVPVSVAVVVSLFATATNAAIVPAELLVKEGDTPQGQNESVQVINQPFTDGEGVVATLSPKPNRSGC